MKISKFTKPEALRHQLKYQNNSYTISNAIDLNVIDVHVNNEADVTSGNCDL